MDHEVPLPHDYDDTNRAFLQAFMSRGSLTLAEARPIIAAILSARGGDEVGPDAVTDADLSHFVGQARQAVAPLEYDVRTTQHQVRKDRVWALVNSHSDPATQLATTHTADEIAFIKRLLDAMFDKFNRPRMECMCVTEMQAVKFSRPPAPAHNDGDGDGDGDNNNGGGGASQRTAADKGLKHTEVEQLLKSLVSEGWLERSRDGFFSLSPRALMELRSWLVETYNDPDAAEDDWQRIKFCEACKEIVTVGQRCAELECNMRLHDICEDAFWRTRREKKCVRCERPWDGQRFVGERAVTATDAYRRASRRGRGRRSNPADEIMLARNDEEEEKEGKEEGG